MLWPPGTPNLCHQVHGPVGYGTVRCGLSMLVVGQSRKTTAPGGLEPHSLGTLTASPLHSGTRARMRPPPIVVLGCQRASFWLPSPPSLAATTSATADPPPGQEKDPWAVHDPWAAPKRSAAPWETQKRPAAPGGNRLIAQALDLTSLVLAQALPLTFEREEENLSHREIRALLGS